jgi:hypothetical protein
MRQRLLSAFINDFNKEIQQRLVYITFPMFPVVLDEILISHQINDILKNEYD